MTTEMDREKEALLREGVKLMKEIDKLQADYRRMRKENPEMPKMPFLES